MSSQHDTTNKKSLGYTLSLTLAALGVVFGDIGTSPLYALRECFAHGVGLAPDKEAVLGVLSLIVWSLILVVTLKYLLFVMRADNKGEGGILSLMSLAFPLEQRKWDKKIHIRLVIGLFGAALLYGDGIITPAISVLSAVEGLKYVNPVFENYIISITVVILLFLFLVQRSGTAKIGLVFGPVILIWFSSIGVLGILSILKNPDVLAAINPLHGIQLLFQEGKISLLILGSVFLAVTGAEALYADMGHFGIKPIKIGWFYVAFPGLVLNYFGQGALILSDPTTIENPFYSLAPQWGKLPLVLLATSASVIASQALISGAFSMTKQAIIFGHLPRMTIKHTSSKEIGQIYIPLINYLLLLGTLGLVLGFKSSANLASAYGIAVAGTMMITTMLTFFVTKNRWHWPLWLSILVCSFFFAIDLIFFGANLIKVESGGWLPLVLGAAIFTLMTTWWTGRQLLGERLLEQSEPLENLLSSKEFKIIPRVPGVAIYMTRNIDRTPPALLHNIRHNKVIHKNIIFLVITSEDIPFYKGEDKLVLKTLAPGFYTVRIRYGFMEDPDVPEILRNSDEPLLSDNFDAITFFFGRETLLASDRPGMWKWREELFALMSRNAARATAFYQIPPEQVIEIGFQIEL